MATRHITRSLLTTTKQTLATAISRSSTFVPNSNSYLFRLRPLLTASFLQRVASVFPTRNLSTQSNQSATSSAQNPNPKPWNRRAEEITLDGCDFEHWLVMMDKPEGEPSRDEIIDGYIKTVASIVGSEEEARQKIYSVSTKHYYSFGVQVNEELSSKLKELPNVQWVLPDSYLDVKNKDYGGEPFINGEAVPYDPKYHEEWVRNNAQAMKRKERPPNSRSYERKDGNARGRDGNMGAGAVRQKPNMHQQQPNGGGMQPPYAGGYGAAVQNQNKRPSPGHIQSENAHNRTAESE